MPLSRGLTLGESGIPSVSRGGRELLREPGTGGFRRGAGEDILQTPIHDDDRFVEISQTCSPTGGLVWYNRSKEVLLQPQSGTLPGFAAVGGVPEQYGSECVGLRKERTLNGRSLSWLSKSS
jgi:hypothetical protein